jgi:hypothetical protein
MFEGTELEAQAEAVVAYFQTFIAALRARRALVAAGVDPVEAVQPYVAVGEQALHAVAGFVREFYPDDDYEASAPAWVEAVLAAGPER